MDSSGFPSLALFQVVNPSRASGRQQSRRGRRLVGSCSASVVRGTYVLIRG